ncbi:MAG: hypothetical protein ACFNLD_07065 [Kingella oralis]|uniref:hypothetical protein n=1 Tax=Kingella oralis TaxID=505 RepID=UPI0034E53F03
MLQTPVHQITPRQPENQNTLSGCLNPIPHPPRQSETKFNTAQIHAAPNSQKEAP